MTRRRKPKYGVYQRLSYIVAHPRMYLSSHSAALKQNDCAECGAKAGELCKMVHNKPFGAPLRYHVHELRLEEALVQAMKKAAREP